jgi:hypothetical protein
MTLIDDFVQRTPGPRSVEQKPCVICRRDIAQRTYRTCGTCSWEVESLLGEIDHLHAEHVDDPDSVLPAPGLERTGSPVYQSSSPTSLRRIDLTDPRPGYDGMPRDALGILRFWADAVREFNELPIPQPRCATAARMARGTVHSQITVLLGYWWWIRAHPAAADFARQLRRIRDELLELAHDRAGLVRIGRCVGDDGIECNQLLQARVGDRAITCPSCGTRWPALRWPELRKLTS